MSDQRDIERARRLLASASRVAVLTGAGISAESGLPTFRGAGGLWNGFDSEDLASPAGWARDPLRVWRWHNQLRLCLREAVPNAGHEALARLGQRKWEQFTLATQNIDALHQRAGSRDVLELHGSLLVARCDGCRDRRALDLHDNAIDPPPCPHCRRPMRPDVVWFGEPLPEATWQRACEAARTCQVFLMVGTSAVVYPAAGLAELAVRAGASLIEVNLEPTAMSPLAAVSLHDRAGAVLPLLE